MLSLNPERICLLRTSAIGDTVHALGLLNALRRGYPTAHVTWVLQQVPYEMVRYQPGIDQFIPFDRKSNLKGWLRLITRLRKETFDLVIAPQASAKVSLLTACARARTKLGFDWTRSRDLHWLVTNRHIPKRPMQHVQDQFLEFADFLGASTPFPQWDFRFTSDERRWQKSFFTHLDRPTIGLVIASAHAHKDWPPAYYARIADWVYDHLDCYPLLLGGPSGKERRMAEDIVSRCNRHPQVALEKSIRRTMLQLDGCRLVVSPDTGPLHIAVALNTPTIGLYAYSNPRRCGPYRFLDLLIDEYNTDEESSAPVTRKTKPDRMDRIQPEAVMDKIELGFQLYPPKKPFEEASQTLSSLSGKACFR